MIKAAALDDWNENGFLVLPGFFSEEDVTAIQKAYSDAWNDPSNKIVVDDLTTNRRCLLSELSAEERAHRYFKVNDLYLEYSSVRNVALDGRVVPLLEKLLLGEVPVLCNTLSLKRGSQQASHVDSLYMTPRTPGHLVATWMALEDVHPESGPLTYYAGSHLIPAYRFSNGSFHFVQTEMGAFRAYYAREVEKRGLVPTTFLAKRGDLFIWHAQLLHGGSPVGDPLRTRDSLVSHFYSKTDCEAQACELVPLNGAFWMQRPPQAIPAPEKTRIPRWLKASASFFPASWKRAAQQGLTLWEEKVFRPN